MADITYNWSEVEWWSDATSDSRVRAYWRVVAWCEETDSENYSDVYFAIEKSITNTEGGWASYPSSKSMTITGTGAAKDTHKATATWKFEYCDTSSWVDATGDYSDFYWSKVKHNDDGTLTVKAHITGDRVVSSSEIDTYINLTFPTIPRQSNITSFSNFTIESGLSVTYKDALSNKALTLACKMGSADIFSKSYTSSAGNHTVNISFTESELATIYSNIGANNSSATFKLTLSTSGFSTTSSKEAKGSLASASNKPELSTPTMAEASESMIAHGIASTEVLRHLSRKKITVTVTPKNNATVKSVVVKNGDSGSNVTMAKESGNTYSAIVTPTFAKFIVTATDSRGFSTSGSVTGTLKEYVYPSVTKVAFDRDSAVVSSGFVQPTGSYWAGTAGNTTNSVTWHYQINSGTASEYYEATHSGSSWSGSTTLPVGTLLRDHTYYCDVTVKDAFDQTATYRVSIGIAELSVWIGKRTVRAEGIVADHYINVFPVGAIYMSVTDTNPGSYFGGTWVQIAQGRTLIGVGSIDANTTTAHGSVTAGGFTAVANEKGGTYSHSHGRGNLAAAIGAVENNVGSIAYYTGSVVPGGPTTTNRYAYGDMSVYPYNDDEQYTFNHYTPVYGNTSSVDEVTPYLAVYIWQRTA